MRKSSTPDTIWLNSSTAAGEPSASARPSRAVGDIGLVWQLLAAAAVQLPALWLVAGLTVALYGVAPRAVAASWLVPGYALFVGMFGGLVGLPGWTLDLSPFALVPLLPVDDFALLPIVGLTLAAGALAALGAVGFSRRDLR